MPQSSGSVLLALLRPAGAALLCGAWVTAHHLFTLGPATTRQEPLTVYLLSILLFACSSAGAAFLIHGRHLFDPVAISARWMAKKRTNRLESQWAADLEIHEVAAAPIQRRR
jgi:hypothetical protein